MAKRGGTMTAGRKLSSDLSAEYADLLTRTMKLLSDMRKLAYENMNQFQHEYRCLQMVAELKGRVPGGTRPTWHWHPAQTSHPCEGDVVGYSGKKPVAQAEVTTSARPGGKIDERMRDKLKVLAALPGRYKFYGVVSEKMRIRAETKAKAHKITVVLLSGPDADATA